MSIGAKPLLDPTVCPSCYSAPCRSFSAIGGFGRRMLAVPVRSVPLRCPLLISGNAFDRYAHGLDQDTARQICAAASQGGISIPGTLHGLTPAQVAAGLVRTGKVALLAAPSIGGGRGFSGGGGGSKRAAPNSAQEKEAGEVAKDEPKPSLFDPAWIEIAKGAETALTSASLGAAVSCKVNTDLLSLGDSVVFTVFLKGSNGAADTKLETLSGRVGEGRDDEAAVAKWVVPESGCGRDLEPEKDKIYFVAKRNAENLTVQSPLLNLARMPGECAEVRDALFFHDSGLMSLLPKDGDAFASLGILADAFAFGAEHPDKVVILYGHADTTGDAAYNISISRRRAEAVKALLDGDADAWVAIAQEKGSHESVANLLGACAAAFGWECDPGMITSKDDPALESAVKAFQAGFNFEYDGSLTEDGKLGRQTWAALFRIQKDQLGLLLEARGLEGSASLNYAGSRALVACGEKYPLEAAEKDGFKSQRNRRVEIAFLDKAKRLPKSRGQVFLGPITIVPGEAKPQGSLTEIVLSCGHGTEMNRRRASKGKDLEIVSDLSTGDKITFEAIGSDVSKIAWTISEYENWAGDGSKLTKAIKGWRLENENQWLPNISPKIVKVRAIHPDGTERRGGIFIYPSHLVSLKLDGSKIRAGKINSKLDKLGELLKGLLKITRSDVKIKLLQGSASIQFGFMEEKKSPLVYWGYNAEFAFSPLAAIALKLTYPTPINQLPQFVRDRCGDFEIYGEIAGGFDFGCKIEKASKEGKTKFTVHQPLKGKLDVTVGMKLTVMRPTLWIGNGDEYILRAEGKAKAGGYLNLTFSEDAIGNDASFGVTPGFSGLKMEASFLFWDGMISTKTELTIIEKKELDPVHFSLKDWSIGRGIKA